MELNTAVKAKAIQRLTCYGCIDYLFKLSVGIKLLWHILFGPNPGHGRKPALLRRVVIHSQDLFGLIIELNI